MSVILTPETLAEKLNTADDAREMEKFNNLVLFSKRVADNHPVDYAVFHLEPHYTTDEMVSFAMPGSRQKTNTDWRGVPINSNKIPIWDYVNTTDTITGSKIVYRWYRRFAERLAAGKVIADTKDILVKCGKPDDYDLKTMASEGKTVVTVMTRERNPDGTPKMLTVDARNLSTKDRESYVSTCDGLIGTIANGYAKAYKILMVKHEILRTPEFNKQLAIDWNWIDVQDHSKGLNNNNVPIMVHTLAPDGGRLASEPVSLETWFKLDIDGTIDAAHKAGRNPTVRDLLDSRFKKPDDRAGAGQGETEDARRASRIKVEGDNSMKDVLNEMVPFFQNDATVSAFKTHVYKMKGAEQADVWFNFVELSRLLDKLLTDDMVNTHRKVTKEMEETERREREEKAKATAEREQASAQPTQTQRNEDANTQVREPEARPEPEAPVTSKKVTAASSKRRAV